MLSLIGWNVLGVLLMFLLYAGSMLGYFSLRKRMSGSKFMPEVVMVALPILLSISVKLVIAHGLGFVEIDPKTGVLESIGATFEAVYSAIGGLTFEGLSVDPAHAALTQIFYSGSSLYAGLMVLSVITARASYEIFSAIRIWFIRFKAYGGRTDFYLFTSVTEEALILAKSVTEKYATDYKNYKKMGGGKKPRKCIIIFTGAELDSFDGKNALHREIMANNYYYWSFSKSKADEEVCIFDHVKLPLSYDFYEQKPSSATDETRIHVFAMNMNENLSGYEAENSSAIFDDIEIIAKRMLGVRKKQKRAGQDDKYVVTKAGKKAVIDFYVLTDTAINYTYYEAELDRRLNAAVCDCELGASIFSKIVKSDSFHYSTTLNEGDELTVLMGILYNAVERKHADTADFISIFNGGGREDGGYNCALEFIKNKNNTKPVYKALARYQKYDAAQFDGEVEWPAEIDAQDLKVAVFNCLSTFIPHRVCKKTAESKIFDQKRADVYNQCLLRAGATLVHSALEVAKVADHGEVDAFIADYIKDGTIGRKSTSAILSRIGKKLDDSSIAALTAFFDGYLKEYVSLTKAELDKRNKIVCDADKQKYIGVIREMFSLCEFKNGVKFGCDVVSRAIKPYFQLHVINEATIAGGHLSKMRFGTERGSFVKYDERTELIRKEQELLNRLKRQSYMPRYEKYQAMQISPDWQGLQGGKRDFDAEYQVKKKSSIFIRDVEPDEENTYRVLVLGFGTNGQQAMSGLYQTTAYVNSEGVASQFVADVYDTDMDRIGGLFAMNHPSFIWKDCGEDVSPVVVSECLSVDQKFGHIYTESIISAKKQAVIEDVRDTLKACDKSAEDIDRICKDYEEKIPGTFEQLKPYVKPPIVAFHKSSCFGLDFLKYLDGVTGVNHNKPKFKAIIIALGDDELNISMANALLDDIRHEVSYYSINSGSPLTIYINVRNESNLGRINWTEKDEKNPRLTNFNVILFGRRDVIFSYESIIDEGSQMEYNYLYNKASHAAAKEMRIREVLYARSENEVDCVALINEFNKKARENDYYDMRRRWLVLSPFKHRSNAAACEFKTYYKQRMRKDNRAKEVTGCDYSSAFIRELAAIEHERWNRFHIANGWFFASSRSDVNKEHDSLCPYVLMRDSDKVYDVINVINNTEK